MADKLRVTLRAQGFDGEYIEEKERDFFELVEELGSEKEAKFVLGEMLLASTKEAAEIREEKRSGNEIKVESEIEAEPGKRKCPGCGAEFTPGSNFCEKCGSRLGTEKGETLKKTCPACGAEVNREDNFCNKCGKRF